MAEEPVPQIEYTEREMTIDEFAHEGLLLEINRLVLHPRGVKMAFQMRIEEDGSRTVTNPVPMITKTDYPEGCQFHPDELQKMRPFYDRACALRDRFKEARKRLFGFGIVQRMQGEWDIIF